MTLVEGVPALGDTFGVLEALAPVGSSIACSGSAVGAGAWPRAFLPFFFIHFGARIDTSLVHGTSVVLPGTVWSMGSVGTGSMLACGGVVGAGS